MDKCMERKLDGNCTGLLRLVSNESWKPHTPKQLLYRHLPPIEKPTQTRRAR